MYSSLIDTPPSSLMDLIANPKVKTTKGKGVEVHSMVCSTLGFRGMLELRDGDYKD